MWRVGETTEGRLVDEIGSLIGGFKVALSFYNLALMFLGILLGVAMVLTTYALVRHAVRARLRRIGAQIDGEPVAPAPASEYLESARAAAFVHAYLPPHERESCLAPLAAMPSAPTQPVLALRREGFTFAEPDPRAASAVRAYASQLGALFGATDPAAVLLGDSPHIESVWWRI